MTNIIRIVDLKQPKFNNMKTVQKTFTKLRENDLRFGEIPFLKKEIGIYKKEVSGLQKTLIFSKLKKYNAYYKTKFSITFDQVGEANLWKIDSITGGSENTIIESLEERLKEEVKKAPKKIKNFINGKIGRAHV